LFETALANVPPAVKSFELNPFISDAEFNPAPLLSTDTFR